MMKIPGLRINTKTRIFFILLALFSFPPAVTGAPWYLLGQDDVYAIYVDAASMTLISDTASKVWIKVVPNGCEYKEDILKSLKERGLTLEGYEGFAYRTESIEIECALERHRILETADYDVKDRKLNTSVPVSGWKETRPGTPYASLTKVICRQHSEDGYWWDNYPAHQNHE